jgi:thiol-disulfide isomerase/thioredoxin
MIAMVLSLQLFAGVSEGEKAVAFDLKTLEGSKSYQMDDFKGKVVLLNLWGSWCGGCKKEMPEFFKLQKESDKGFEIVAVSIYNKASESEKFLHSLEGEVGYKTPFLTLHDPDKMLPKAYGAVAMPSSYLIDKEGVVRAVIVGSLDADDIEELKLEINKLK